MVETDAEIVMVFPRHLIDDLPDKLESYASRHTDERTPYVACAAVFRGWLAVPGNRIRCTRSFARWGWLSNAALKASAFTFAAVLSAKLGRLQAREESSDVEDS